MTSISVIVPTFRREEPLCRMLQSLLTQDIDDFEILLIDQTSDHTEETKRFLSANSARIRRIVQSTANLPMARNTGLSLASGHSILFIDDDVILPSDCVRRITSHLSQGTADGVTGVISFDNSLEQLRRQYGMDIGGNPSHVELVFVRRFIGAVMGFRRSVFESIGGFDERLGILSPSAAGEDYELCRRATRARFRLAIDPTLIIMHPLGSLGGCAAREAPPAVARMRQIQSSFYIEMKMAARNGQIGIQGWARIVRGWAVNRAMLRDGIGVTIERLKELRQCYKNVQLFYNEGAAPRSH